MGLLSRVVQILLIIAVLVLCWYLTIWVLGLLGVNVPRQILTVIMVILGLIALGGILTGRFDDWWRRGP